MNNKDRHFQIAILLYPGVTALDAVGPWEVLSRMPNTEVRFVGKEVGPLMTEGRALLLGVTHTVAETLSPDLVLVPGGTTSAGGTAALVVKKLRAENGAKNLNPKTQTEGEQNENQNREKPNEPSESGVAG